VKILCDIYKTASKDEMYLYLCRAKGFKCVPDVLLKNFGEPVLVTTFVLTEAKKLARADITKVMADLTLHGFYLQMPPPKFPKANDSQ
jgi:uncharacterized protein YcgL (UPF0745 family)|tara:strand:- start:5047 stop:5310 length:264 start_codon:yes stop_codon:yes gene_type:complete